MLILTIYYHGYRQDNYNNVVQQFNSILLHNKKK